MNAGTRATLALDALLQRPDAVEILDYLNQLAPVHYRDQADAAALDAHYVQDAFRAAMSDEPHVRDGRNMPDWIRLGAIDSIRRHIDGTADTCLHNPSADRPQPVVAAAWKPGLITCVRCIHLFKLTGTAADLVCDGCGRQCEGPQVDDGIYQAVVRLGLLVFHYGTCTDCHHESLRASAP